MIEIYGDSSQNNDKFKMLIFYSTFYKNFYYIFHPYIKSCYKTKNKFSIINNFLTKMQVTHQQPCPNCHRSVESSRLPLHIHMCSTIKLRQSRIFANSEPKPKKEQLYGDGTTICIFCERKMKLGEMEEHMGSCQFRQVECEGCGEMHPFSSMWQHQKQCHGKGGQQKQVQAERMDTVKQEQGAHSESESKWERASSEITVQNLKKGLGIIGEKLLIEGSRFANYCGDLFEQKKGPALQTLSKLKQSLFYRIQDVFTTIAADPNTDGLPRRQIKQIQLGQYRARNDGQEQEMCTICYCNLQDLEEIKILNCRHIYHPSCIDKWMKINKLCPLCKSDQSRTK